MKKSKILQPQPFSYQANPFMQKKKLNYKIKTNQRMMFDEADAFVALPGGFGTLEELLEMVSCFINLSTGDVLLSEMR